MTRFFGLLVLLALTLCVSPQAQSEETDQPIRILLTFGGHGFEQEPFFAMFDELPGIEYDKAPLPEQADLLKPGLEKQYDAIVMYDMVKEIKPEQQAAFQALVQKGIGVVSLHHNIGAHRNWDEFSKIIGGKYIFQDEVHEGQAYKKSTWSHGEDLKVTIADPEHPITKGMDAFDIHDESYGGFYTASDVHVLLRTDHPKNDPELAWTKTYGNSRVFYLMLGHDHHAWQNAAYPKLLERGIRWVTKR